MKSIEVRISEHETVRNTLIEQQQMTLREHTDHIASCLMFVKEKNSTGGFEREKKYYTKIERSIKNKKKEDKLRLAMLHDNNGKRTEAVDINLKDIRHK